MCNLSLVAPSCPSAFQILENAPAEGLPPPYHTAVDINRLLAIPTASRNASEIKAVIAHRENETTSSSQVQREQHWPPADHGLYNSAGGLINLLQGSAQIIFGRMAIISLRTKVHTTVLDEMQLLPLTVEPFPNSYTKNKNQARLSGFELTHIWKV